MYLQSTARTYRFLKTHLFNRIKKLTCDKYYFNTLTIKYFCKLFVSVNFVNVCSVNVHSTLIVPIVFQTTFEFHEWNSRMPLRTQPSLNYLAPEYILSQSCEVNSDMFSYGILVHAVYNNGQPLFESESNLLTYKQHIENVSDWLYSSVTNVANSSLCTASVFSFVYLSLLSVCLRASMLLVCLPTISRVAWSVCNMFYKLL